LTQRSAEVTQIDQEETDQGAEAEALHLMGFRRGAVGWCMLG
jgi:hypothetical protein